MTLRNWKFAHLRWQDLLPNHFHTASEYCSCFPFCPHFWAIWWFRFTSIVIHNDDIIINHWNTKLLLWVSSSQDLSGVSVSDVVRLWHLGALGGFLSRLGTGGPLPPAPLSFREIKIKFWWQLRSRSEQRRLWRGNYGWWIVGIVCIRLLFCNRGWTLCSLVWYQTVGEVGSWWGCGGRGLLCCDSMH